VTPTDLAPRFFLATVVILLFCHGVARLLGRVGQPAVVSEMLAGVLLGPSLFGALAPGVQAALFPADLEPVLHVVGQVGLVLLMFQAGYDLTAHRVDGLVGTAGAVSAAGVTVPVLLGAGLVLLAGDRVGVVADGVPLGVSAAFVGVTLAVTAFPMLARIITERGQAGTRHGTLALAGGAVDDVVAWILLAGVVAAASGRAGPALLTAGGAVLFAALLAGVGRPAARLLMRTDRLTDSGRLLAVVAALFAAAWYTDEIGLYAVFGAFSTGLVMPRTERTDAVVDTLAPLGRVVLLPLFFTYSGLHTSFDLLGDPGVLAFAAACVLAAVVGKFGACWAAARLRGESPAVALRVGALMNSRGLMQLIALAVGRQAGIVPPTLFTVLVLVALVTTLMTTPLLGWIERREAPATTEVTPELQRMN
jgi:Kef-type K+ transport system membrane component KefB